MDIRLVITKVGIFLMVYSLVLGAPFGLAVWGRVRLVEALGDNWFWVPMTMLFALATLGPFLYTRVRRGAEERILADELRVRDLLIRVSRGMADVRDTGRLLRLVRHVLSRALRVREVRIFLKDPGAGYRAVEGTDRREVTLGYDDPLVKRLGSGRDIIAADDLPVKLKLNSAVKDEFAALASRMREISASLAVPLVVRDELEGFITMDGRQDYEPWTDNILGSLRVMANQTVLALENCRHFEAEKERLTVENAMERRESLDMLVATMAHEIDNPITGVIGQADMVRELVERLRELVPPETYAELLNALQYINTDAWRVSRIVKSVEDYSKGGEGALSPTSVAGALEPYRPLRHLQFKKAGGTITYTEEVEPNLPEVMAEVVLLEEILMNYMENALHAVSRLTTEKRIHLSIVRRGDFVRIEVRDNGYGMSPKVARQVFEVPTTTKGSSEGTGLGLYRVRKICGILGARYGGESPGPLRGSAFWVEIPVIKKKDDAMDDRTENSKGLS
jgi:signal transduction histidine kinase